MYRTTLCLTVLLAGGAVAQQTDLHIASTESSQHVKIETRSQVNSERQIRVDGEAMEGRGPAGPSSRDTTVVVEFVERPSGADGIERTYTSLTATATGPDGQPIELEGDGVGKTLAIRGTDEKTVTLDGEELPGRAASRIPGAMDFAALTPSEPVEVDAEFPMGAGFQKIFGLLEHPLFAGTGRPSGAPGDNPGARPDRAPREGQEGAAPTAPGQRGARGNPMRAAMAARDPAVSLLAQTRLEPQATGKVVEVDDQGIARVEFHGTISGEGAPDELGMSAGFGGRGGRGGRGQPQPAQEQAPQGTARVDVTFEGFLLVDTRSHRVQSLVIEGQLASNLTQSMDRRGQAFEVDMKQDGTFRIAVASEPAPLDEAATDKKPD